MTNTELPMQSSRKLSACLIFNVCYEFPAETIAHIVEARYGAICDRTIADGVSAIDAIKKKQPLCCNDFILVSVNLAGNFYQYPQKTRALLKAIEEQNKDASVVLLTHTDEAAKIYENLYKRGCHIGTVTPLFGSQPKSAQKVPVPVLSAT